MKLKVMVKATRQVIEVTDHGPKMHPRYWDAHQGYGAEELVLPSLTGLPKKAKLTTPPAAKEYRVSWEIDVDGTSPKAAAHNALKSIQEPGSEACFFTVTRGKKKWNVDLLLGTVKEVK